MDISEKLVLEFLAANKVGVLSVLLQDGTPHGATMHFSSQNSPAKIFFLTDRGYRKCGALLNGNPAPASFTIGTSETEMKTLQLDGIVRLVSDAAALASLKAVHFVKIPSAKKYEDDPDSVFLEFTPSWWRYTDYTTGPETRITG